MSRAPIDVDAEIEYLYRGPLRTFVTDRNALVRELRAEGRKVDANRVKKLVKPGLVAWVLNQLHWRHPDDLEALQSLGDKLRDLQAGKLSRDEARLLPKERQAHLTKLLAQARALLAEGGHASASETERKLAASLDALGSWGTRFPGELGFLSEEIRPPQLEDLLQFAAAPRPALPTPSPPKAPDPKLLRRIRELKNSLTRLTQAEREQEARLSASKAQRDQAVESVREARQVLLKAQEHLEESEKSILEQRRKLSRARAERENIERQLKDHER